MQSQPVARAAVYVSQKVIASAPVDVIVPLAPTERSSRRVGNPVAKPPARVLEQSVVARTVPPAVRPGYMAQPTPLSEKSDNPLDDAVRKPRKPPVTQATKLEEAPDQTDWRKPDAVPAVPVAPRAKWAQQRDNSEQRIPAVAPPPPPMPMPPQRAVEPNLAPPAQAVRPAPAATQTVKPAPVPAPRQVEPDRPVAVPQARPTHPVAIRPDEPRPPVAGPKAPPPQAQAAPKSENHVQKPKPDDRKPRDGKNDNEDPKR